MTPGLLLCGGTEGEGIIFNALPKSDSGIYLQVESSHTHFSSVTVWPLLRVSSMMIFSSSGRRTWGMESLREPVYKKYS